MTILFCLVLFGSISQPQVGRTDEIRFVPKHKAVKAYNAWNRLNLSPAGVEPRIVSKGRL